MASNGSVVPTPKYVDLLPDFEVLGDLFSHALHVAQTVHNPEFKSIIAHFLALAVKQEGVELVKASRDKPHAVYTEIKAEADMLIQYGNVIQARALAQ